MIYLEFLLFFCAIMVTYVTIFSLLGTITIVPLLDKFVKSYIKTPQALHNYFKIYTIIGQLIYCLIILNLAILTIQEFHLKDESIFFRFYMIIITLIFLFYFFADKRGTLIENTKSNTISPYFYKFMHISIAIEWISIAVFIPLVFFPQVFNNYISLKIYEFFSYIASIKILGTILGIVGIIKLGKYILVFSLTIIAKLSKNKVKDD